MTTGMTEIYWIIILLNFNFVENLTGDYGHAVFSFGNGYQLGFLAV